MSSPEAAALAARADALPGVPRRRTAGGSGRRGERLRHGGRAPQARWNALERRTRREPRLGSALLVAGRPTRRVLQGALKTAADGSRRLSRRGHEQICRTPT